jgi:hypothetical protein
MAAPKGHKRYGGRRRGTLNKLTSSARNAFALAFDTIGGAGGLSKWARENRTDFYRLYARLIPVEREELEEEKIGAVKIQIVYPDARKSVEEKLNRLSGDSEVVQIKTAISRPPLENRIQ